MTEDELIDATTGKPNDKRKQTIKEVNRKAEKAEVTHYLRKTHEELLEGFTHTHTHPMWKRNLQHRARYTK